MPDAVDIPLIELVGTPYMRFLTFPAFDLPGSRLMICELASAGVSALRFEGSTTIDGIRILGKGCAGIVTKAVLDEKFVALKLRRVDGGRKTMWDEARLLRLANSVGVGPNLQLASDNFIAMQYFEGLPLYKWVEDGLKTRRDVKHVLGELLFECFKLDSVGLDHGELSRAPRNVLVSNDSVPCIVDFETASTARRTANVTSLIQYFLFGEIARRVNSRRIWTHTRRILKTLNEYKRAGTVESFYGILSVLGLGE